MSELIDVWAQGMDNFLARSALNTAVSVSGAPFMRQATPRCILRRTPTKTQTGIKTPVNEKMTQMRNKTGLAIILLSAVMYCASAVAADAQAVRYYEDAVSRFNSGDLKGAEIQLKNSLTRDPSSAVGTHPDGAGSVGTRQCPAGRRRTGDGQQAGRRCFCHGIATGEGT